MYTIDRLMKVKSLTLLLVFVLISFSGYAQMDKKNQKKLRKVEKLYKKKKYHDAGVLTKEIINAYPINENLWQIYNQVMYANYSTTQSLFSNLSITVKGSEDAEAAGLKSSLEYLFVKPKYDYYNAIYYSAMCTPYNSRSSSMLRNMHIDTRYYDGSKVSTESKDLFALGEEEFVAKNFQKAIEYYQKAYDADTGNYKALLYVGDSYFAMEYFGQAAVYFRQAMQKQPLLNEPIKYLADALQKKGEYSQALEVCKQSLLVYPEETVMIQIHNLLEEQNSNMDTRRNWILRLAPANTVIDTNHREPFFEELLHYQHYVDAKDGADEVYDDNGIRKADVALSNEKYLEVYSWRKMLEATAGEEIPALDYARQMEAEGMLAPYLFISLFNVDCYSQYRDFVDNNKELAMRYINEYLITSDL